MSDVDFINEKWNNYINRVRDDIKRWEKQTKEKYILEAYDIVKSKIEYNILSIQLNDISSYLFKELNKELDVELDDPVFSKRYIQMVLPPEAKGNYSQSEILSQLNESKWIKIIDTDEVLLEQDQFGNKRLNGIEVREVKKPKNVEIDWESENKPKDEINDNYTKCLRVMAKCGNLVERISEALEDEYNSNEESRIIIQKNLFNIKSELEKYLKIHATLTLGRNELDKREKWGDLEKTMFAFLIDVGDTKADLAEKVGYCSKYASIGIERNPKLEEYKKFARECPECHADIAHKINHQIQLYKSGKELEIPLPISGY